MEKAQPLSKQERDELRRAELKKVMELPRKQKRARLRIRHGADARPFSRVRSGTRTGTSAHFAAWKAELEVKSTLQRMTLEFLADSLADEGGKQSLANSFAIIRVNSEYRNVWDLARADISALLSIPQVGPARLRTVEDYLTGKNVALDWTAA